MELALSQVELGKSRFQSRERIVGSALDHHLWPPVVRTHGDLCACKVSAGMRVGLRSQLESCWRWHLKQLDEVDIKVSIDGRCLFHTLERIHCDNSPHTLLLITLLTN